jgi:hypothetical protein
MVKKLDQMKGTVAYEELFASSLDVAQETMRTAVDTMDRLKLERDPALIIAYMEFVRKDYALMVAERRANGHT